YFDVAPSYGDAEERLGPALEPFRKDVFLACKTNRRDKKGAAAALRESLKKLRTEHFDLYQLHGLTTMEEVDQVLGSNGALEAVLEARKAGLVRFVGFSAHSEEAALRVMDSFDFDSVLFPFNFVTYYTGNFGPEVLKKATEKGVARLALKTLARSPYSEGSDRSQYPKCWYQPILDPIERNLALRWTLSLNITAAIPPGHAELFSPAVDIAENFQPLTDSELAEVKKQAATIEPLFKSEL
ncbi:MAG: aldo/keto reductase, partial [bacterium]